MMDGAWGTKDRRRDTRAPVDIDARVLPGGYLCRIVNLSDGGAMLRIPAGVLPPVFVLVEWPTGRAHEVQVRWREGPEVGVQFRRSCDLRGMVPSAFVAAKSLWMAGRG
jgi:hypothetical protein